MAATAIPGMAKGIMTLKMVLNLLAPSTLAASSSSCGMVSKVPTKIQVARGNVIIICARINSNPKAESYKVIGSATSQRKNLIATGNAIPTSGYMRVRKSTRISPYFRLGDSLDIEALEKIAINEYKASVCKKHSFLCNDEGVELIHKDIKDEGINTVAIGACSPRVNYDIFRFGDSNIRIHK